MSGGLFFKRAAPSSGLLSLFILLFSFETLEFLYSTSVLADLYPFFYGRYYFLSGFVYGPIVYFYYRSLANRIAFSAKDLLHFLPVVLVFVYMLDIYLLDDVARMAYLQDHFLDRIMPVNYARGVHNLGYGLVFASLIRRNYPKLIPSSRLFTVFFCVVFFLTAILGSWLIIFANSWRDFIVYYLILYSVVFASGIMMYLDPEFLQRLTSKYLKSSLTEREMEGIYARLNTFLIAEKPFLDGSLTLSSLADQINEKPHHISQTLSSITDQNFNSYINRFRIEHAKLVLLDEAFDHYKIEAIGLESGFNNKVTFYRAFKEVTSMSPSEYRAEHSPFNSGRLQ